MCSWMGVFWQNKNNVLWMALRCLLLYSSNTSDAAKIYRIILTLHSASKNQSNRREKEDGRLIHLTLYYKAIAVKKCDTGIRTNSKTNWIKFRFQVPILSWKHFICFFPCLLISTLEILVCFLEHTFPILVFSSLFKKVSFNKTILLH